MSGTRRKGGDHKRSAQEQDSSLDAELRALLEIEHAAQSHVLAVKDIEWAERCLDDLQTQVRVQDNSLHGRLAALPSWKRASAAILIAVLTLGIVFVWKPRSDLDTYPGGTMAFALLSLLALGLWLGADALRGWHRPALSWRGAALRFGLSIALLVGLSMLPVPIELAPHSISPRGMPFFLHAGACLLFGLAAALPTFVACHVLGRGAPLTSWIAAMVSGVVGNFALQLHCPIREHAHLLAGHAALGVVVVAYVALPRMSKLLRA